MRCPFCRFDETKVLDKRDSDDFLIRRRRECQKCKKRFTTYETIANIDISVVKKDGNRQRFDKEKLLIGLLKACEKRPVPRDVLEKTADEIEDALKKKGKEVKSSFIGNLVMKKLQKIDKVAYVRFASVYKDFQDIDDFNKEIKELN